EKKPQFLLRTKRGEMCSPFKAVGRSIAEGKDIAFLRFDQHICMIHSNIIEIPQIHFQTTRYKSSPVQNALWSVFFFLITGHLAPGPGDESIVRILSIVQNETEISLEFSTSDSCLETENKRKGRKG
ncbi:hypothetical protein AVEN_258988-1, partial [Araneus ventricosus]